MPQTTNPFLDQFAKFMTDAAGAAQGARAEMENVMRTQGERWLRAMDVPQREEFEAVKAMAEKARAENEALKARVAELEQTLRSVSPQALAQPSQTPPQEPGMAV
jgi:BMFP domain-containing protein YqiC